jgi:uncharacterized protein
MQKFQDAQNQLGGALGRLLAVVERYPDIKSGQNFLALQSEIEDYGYQLGRAWGIGQKKLNNGVLFIVAPNERKVRIEVGYGVEGVLTDAYSSVIIQTKILPRFRDNDYPGGIAAGTDAIIEQLTADPADAKARADKAATRKPVLDEDATIFIIILILVLAPHLLVLLAVMGLFGGRARKWVRSSRGGSGWISSGGSGWSSGSSGGFSGGGGSFGGGGSSGGW